MPKGGVIMMIISSQISHLIYTNLHTSTSGGMSDLTTIIVDDIFELEPLFYTLISNLEQVKEFNSDTIQLKQTHAYLLRSRNNPNFSISIHYNNNNINYVYIVNGDDVIRLKGI